MHLNDASLDDWVDSLTMGTISPLGEAGATVGPPLKGTLITAERLMRDVIAVGGLDGFTLSPHGLADTHMGSLDSHHAVTLPGSECLLPREISPDPGEYMSDEALDEIDAWLEVMEPALASGHAWVGGYRHTEGPLAGRFEINATVVFKPECHDDAEACGRLWNQKSIWTFGEGETETGGDGLNSVFAPLDEPDEQGRSRTLRSMLGMRPR